MRPGLDQRALDGGGPAAAPDPTASVRLRAFSLRSTDRRQDGGAVGGAWIPPSCRAAPGAWVCRHVPLPVAGSHLPGSGRRYRYGDSHDAPRGAAIRGRSGFRQRLRSEGQPMGHSKNHGLRGLTLPLQLRAKLIGLSILIAGLAPLITSAQLDPIMVQVERD